MLLKIAEYTIFLVTCAQNLILCTSFNEPLFKSYFCKACDVKKYRLQFTGSAKPFYIFCEMLFHTVWLYYHKTSDFSFHFLIPQYVCIIIIARIKSNKIIIKITEEKFQSVLLENELVISQRYSEIIFAGPVRVKCRNFNCLKNSASSNRRQRVDRSKYCVGVGR